MGIRGGIRRVFGGIPIIFKVFGRVAIFADMAVTTPAVLSDPPKFPFYKIKRGLLLFSGPRVARVAADGVFGVGRR